LIQVEKLALSKCRFD